MDTPPDKTEDKKSINFALGSILNDKHFKKREFKPLDHSKMRRPSLPFRLGGRIGKKLIINY